MNFKAQFSLHGPWGSPKIAKSVYNYNNWGLYIVILYNHNEMGFKTNFERYVRGPRITGCVDVVITRRLPLLHIRLEKD